VRARPERDPAVAVAVALRQPRTSPRRWRVVGVRRSVHRDACRPHGRCTRARASQPWMASCANSRRRTPTARSRRRRSSRRALALRCGNDGFTVSRRQAGFANEQQPLLSRTTRRTALCRP